MFWLPLAAGAATTGINEWQRQKRRKDIEGAFNRSRPPSIDFWMRRSNLRRQVGEGTLDQVRGYGETQSARGINDPGAAFSAGRLFTQDAANRTDEGLARIQEQEDEYKRAVAEWEAKKAAALAGQPDFANSLAEGLNTGMQAYQFFNPQQFTTQYPEMNQPTQQPFQQLPEYDNTVQGFRLNTFSRPKIQNPTTRMKLGLNFNPRPKSDIRLNALPQRQRYNWRTGLSSWNPLRIGE
jgi:hypothetical protein